MRMDERKQRVLEAIIKEYVSIAEPVGSRTLARKYELGVSAATIRNEMADLEEMGLIEQPHTSAGRIPSQRGYRYYVDCLMEKQNLQQEEKSSISQGLARKIRELDTLEQEAGRLLHQITSYTSLVAGTAPGKNSVRRVEFIYLQPGQALVVIITSNGKSFNHLLEISDTIKAQDLQNISHAINERLEQIALNGLRKTLLQELKRELVQQRKLLFVVLDLLEDVQRYQAEEKVYLGGILNILNQPEFRNVEKIRRFLTVLEEENTVRDLLADSAQPGISIRIGDENRREEFQDCSVITAACEVEGEVIGRLGILGPTRMDYSKGVAVLEFVTNALANAIRDVKSRKD